MKFVLRCRHDNCHCFSVFDSTSDIATTDWTHVSLLGAPDSEWTRPDETFRRHWATCPQHPY